MRSVGLVGEPLANKIRAWDSASRKRAVRSLEQATAQGWTGSPNRGDTWHSDFSRFLLCKRCKCASSGAGVQGRFKPEYHAFFSLYQMAPGEPSTVEHAPGDSRFSHRPLLRADMSALNANRRGFKTRSKGQDEPAGLALLDGNGPVSQSRRHCNLASASVPKRGPHQASARIGQSSP